MHCQVDFSKSSAAQHLADPIEIDHGQGRLSFTLKCLLHLRHDLDYLLASGGQLHLFGGVSAGALYPLHLLAKEGILIDVLNPKVAIFFMAFLPQFLRDGYGTTSTQLLYLGIAVIAVALVVETIYILLASKISGAVRNNKSISIWLDRMVGTMFVVLGLKLASSTNT